MPKLPWQPDPPWHPGLLPTLRWSLFCGEALPQESAEAWQIAAPHSTVENLYGPTEVTVACLVHRWDPTRSPALCENGSVPIGKAYDGVDLLVVSKNGAEASGDDPGELCLGGHQTFDGYLDMRFEPRRSMLGIPLVSQTFNEMTGQRIQGTLEDLQASEE